MAKLSGALASVLGEPNDTSPQLGQHPSGARSQQPKGCCYDRGGQENLLADYPLKQPVLTAISPTIGTGQPPLKPRRVSSKAVELRTEGVLRRKHGHLVAVGFITSRPLHQLTRKTAGFAL